MIKRDHIIALSHIAGPNGATTDQDIIAPHIREWRDKFHGQTPLMLMPDNAEVTAKLLAYCHDHNIKIIPQGGNTGLVGGGIPGLDGRDEILLSTKRMTDISTPQGEGWTLTAGAGATIQAVQDMAANHDRLFPLSLASQGSCTVGGTIATNAGGIHVIRYGTMRRLVAGVEAVTAQGDIINTLSPLDKDNTGYDLTSLLCGSEGTLAVVTRATLRLAPPERVQATAWLGVSSLRAALQILSAARVQFDDCMSAFEVISAPAYELALKHIPNARTPIEDKSAWHILIELGSSNPDRTLNIEIEDWLSSLYETNKVKDAAIAQSDTQRTAFWSLREGLSEAQKHEGGSIKHDISLPHEHIAEFVDHATETLHQIAPGARLTPFGHLGDGNLHFNLMQPADTPKEAFLSRWPEINDAVHQLVTQYGGSISAEHGIGTLKRNDLAVAKPAAELTLMKQIKSAFDPKNILNPNALFIR